MPVGAALGAAAPIVGGLLGKAVGGGGAKNAQAALPKDLQGMRGNNIGLLNYLLGYSNQAPWQQGLPPASQGGPIHRGDMGGNGSPQWGAPGQGNGWGVTPGGQYGQAGGQQGGGQSGGVGGAIQSMLPQLMAQHGGGMSGGGFNPQSWQQIAGGMGFSNAPPDYNPKMPGEAGYGVRWDTPGGPGGKSQMPGMVNFGGGSGQGGMSAMGGPAAGSPGAGMLGRMESYFGPLGTPTTALQQQSLGGISQFLNSNPYGQSNSALQGILGTGPQNYFGGAQNAYNKVGNTNYFGGAQDAFNQLGQGNYYGDAQGAFKDLQNYNPFQPAQHSLEGMFAQNPGQGMLDALRPQFEQNMAAANQQGGRFGSANAIMRSHALNDYNLLGAQALQHGIDQQIAAAGQYGNMGNSLIQGRLGAGQGLLGVGNGRMQQQGDTARGLLGVGQGRLDQGLGVAQGNLGIGQGRANYANQFMGNQINAAAQMGQNQNNMFQNLQGGYNTGAAQATQEAQRQQQALQILMGQLGVSQQATFGAPTVVSPTGAQQGAQIGSGLAPFLMQALSHGGQGGNNLYGLLGG